MALVVSIALFSAASVFAAHTDPALTVGIVTALHGVALLANYFGFISLPHGVFADYVAGVGMNGGAGVTVINTERERGAFMHVKSDPKYAGKKISPGFLRLEATITNQGSVIFKTFEGDGTTVYATEERLLKNDLFVITEWSLRLLKQDVANKKTSGILQTYPNITVFGAAAAADLWALYSGKMIITISNNKEIQAYDTMRFLEVPRTQQSGAGNYGDTWGRKSGFVALTPHLSLDGFGANELELKYPTWAGYAGGTSADVGFEHRAVLLLRGLTVTGGSANI